MLRVLRNRSFRHLFAAQVIALIGTGLLIVARGLPAYDLARADAGLVPGTALTIKMAAYVGIAPVAQAFAERLPRRRVLVALDLLRAVVALALPFVTEIWQIYTALLMAWTLSPSVIPSTNITLAHHDAVGRRHPCHQQSCRPPENPKSSSSHGDTAQWPTASKIRG